MKKDLLVFAASIVILTLIVYLFSLPLFSMPILFSAVFMIYMILRYTQNKTEIVEDIEIDENIFSTIFDVNDCINIKVPSVDILTNNKIKQSNAKDVEKIAQEIINFYHERGLIIEYRGFESSIKLNTLKFKEHKTVNDKPIRITDITKYEVDLSRMLKLGQNDLKFLETILGEDVFGIVIPSNLDNNVRIKNIFEDADFQSEIKNAQILIEDECYQNSVPIVLGADSKGYVYFEMNSEPHALIAGASGSGKSVCINTILTSLLMLHTENSLHLYLADLKDGIELFDYQGLPHVKMFADTSDDVINMLIQLEKIMSDRFKTIRPYKSIVEYNASIKKKEKFIPYIVVVLDEFITLSNNSVATDYLVQLSAKARAAGIFLILSTQKPTKNVIDTRIKANLNARICFRTTDETESRVVLDFGEAADLRGGGDGILKTSKITRRFQGCFVDRKETTKILNFWKK